MFQVSMQEVVASVLLFAFMGVSQMAHASYPVPADSLRAAIMASDRGDYKVALSIMNKLVAKEPLSYQLYINRCSVYVHLKDAKNALKDINKAFELMELPDNKKSVNPEVYAIGLLNRACVFQELGKDSEALADLQKSVKLNHLLMQAHWKLALLYKKQGKKELALQSYKTAESICKQFNQVTAATKIEKEIAELESKPNAKAAEKK